MLSQCNSWIILRITNESDRGHVRGILPDSLEGLTKMLSGLRRQEAIFVGQAATLPSRIMIRELSNDELPSSRDVDFDIGWQSEAMTDEQLDRVCRTLAFTRGVEMGFIHALFAEIAFTSRRHLFG